MAKATLYLLLLYIVAGGVGGFSESIMIFATVFIGRDVAGGGKCKSNALVFTKEAGGEWD